MSKVLEVITLDIPSLAPEERRELSKWLTFVDYHRVGDFRKELAQKIVAYGRQTTGKNYKAWHYNDLGGKPSYRVAEFAQKK